MKCSNKTAIVSVLTETDPFQESLLKYRQEFQLVLTEASVFNVGSVKPSKAQVHIKKDSFLLQPFCNSIQELVLWPRQLYTVNSESPLGSFEYNQPFWQLVLLRISAVCPRPSLFDQSAVGWHKTSNMLLGCSFVSR